MRGAPAPSLLRASSNWKADRLTDEPKPDDRASRQAVIHSLIAEGVPPHIVYAYSKTGMLVTTQMYAQLSEGDRKRWDDALRDFETMEWEAGRSPPH